MIDHFVLLCVYIVLLSVEVIALCKVHWGGVHCWMAVHVCDVYCCCITVLRTQCMCAVCACCTLKPMHTACTLVYSLNVTTSTCICVYMHLLLMCNQVRNCTI